MWLSASAVLDGMIRGDYDGSTYRCKHNPQYRSSAGMSNSNFDGHRGGTERHSESTPQSTNGATCDSTVVPLLLSQIYFQFGITK